MFERDRLFHPLTGTLAGVVLLLLATALLGEPHGAQRAGESTTYQTDPTQQASRESALARRVPEAPEASAKPTRNEWRQEQDLEAQRWMAIWAGAMFFATTIGVIFVAMTLEATKEMVREAKEATEAAKTAVDVTRDTGEAQARCYLAIEGVSFSFSKDAKTTVFTPEPGLPPPSESATFPSVFFQVRNYGNSPARNFRWKPSIKFMAYFVKQSGPAFVERQGPKNFPLVQKPNDWGETIQASDKPMRFNTKYGMALNPAELEARSLSKDLGGLNVVLVISYHATDVFGKSVSEEVTFAGTFHDGVEGGSLLVQLPLTAFDTQAEIASRTETEKAKTIKMIAATGRHHGKTS